MLCLEVYAAAPLAGALATQDCAWLATRRTVPPPLPRSAAICRRGSCLARRLLRCSVSLCVALCLEPVIGNGGPVHCTAAYTSFALPLSPSTPSKGQSLCLRLCRPSHPRHGIPPPCPPAHHAGSSHPRRTHSQKSHHGSPAVVLTCHVQKHLPSTPAASIPTTCARPNARNAGPVAAGPAAANSAAAPVPAHGKRRLHSPTRIHFCSVVPAAASSATRSPGGPPPSPPPPPPPPHPGAQVRRISATEAVAHPPPKSWYECTSTSRWSFRSRVARSMAPPATRRSARKGLPSTTNATVSTRKPPARTAARRRATPRPPRAPRVRFPALPPRVRVQVEEHPHPRGRRPAERLVQVRPHVADVRVPRQWAVSTAAAATTLWLKTNIQARAQGGFRVATAPFLEGAVRRRVSVEEGGVDPRLEDGFGRRVYHGSLGEPVCHKRVWGGDTMAGGAQTENKNGGRPHRVKRTRCKREKQQKATTKRQETNGNYRYRVIHDVPHGRRAHICRTSKSTVRHFIDAWNRSPLLPRDTSSLLFGCPLYLYSFSSSTISQNCRLSRMFTVCVRRLAVFVKHVVQIAHRWDHLDALTPCVEVRLRHLVNLDAAHDGSASGYDSCVETQWG
ncbi:hypothetical protein BU14_0169s0002 [Porphyra umbilicalis]|uniref:Uncharacterized protein n=1 Tax=Porphyra umbilicalis TaxID=2786 RepID=A0A1X6P7N7_PORUM|nr:hypothetical protein BU14_0169s0002 [Porphyra umbilicalis]|eukprot:OSX76901.1 hypothetical protein BU14_0169s0002 [Porphyra umbilicalis]